MEREKREMYSFRLELSIKKEAEKKAIKQKTTLAEVLRAYLRNYVKK